MPTRIKRSVYADMFGPTTGDKVRLAPGHCDPTVNLHDWFVAHRAGRVEAVWPIDARGAVF